MTRTERRAAEHLARKAAYKAMKQNPQPQPAPAPVAVPVPVSVPDAQPQPEISEARLAANRANALLSTGPKTEAGKSRCAQNAVKTALTGQTVLLPNDDIAAYQDLGQITIAKYQPATPEEERLVQSIVNAEWRLLRIPTVEFGIMAIGRDELAASVPACVLEAHVVLKYERSLKNLFLQENRVRRNREKDLKELTELQTARREKEAAAKKLAQLKAQLSQRPQQPSQPEPAQPSVGFEFEAAENLADRPLSKEAAA